MAQDRVISYDQGEALSKQYDAPFFECSAKASINVNAAFECLVTNIITKSPPKVKEPKLKLGGDDTNGGGGNGGTGGNSDCAAKCAK